MAKVSRTYPATSHLPEEEEEEAEKRDTHAWTRRGVRRQYSCGTLAGPRCDIWPLLYWDGARKTHLLPEERFRLKGRVICVYLRLAAAGTTQGSEREPCKLRQQRSLVLACLPAPATLFLRVAPCRAALPRQE